MEPPTITSVPLEQYARVAFAPRGGESIGAYKTDRDVDSDGLGNDGSTLVWVSWRKPCFAIQGKYGQR
jgi:hypothetical protein